MYLSQYTTVNTHVCLQGKHNKGTIQRIPRIPVITSLLISNSCTCIRLIWLRLVFRHRWSTVAFSPCKFTVWSFDVRDKSHAWVVQALRVGAAVTGARRMIRMLLRKYSIYSDLGLYVRYYSWERKPCKASCRANLPAWTLFSKWERQTVNLGTRMIVSEHKVSNTNCFIPTE